MDASGRGYRLSTAQAPWGDYGDILLSGMTAHEPRTADGLLQLERTGPFVPPITLTGISDLLVTGAFRARLERSPLAGLGFRPVVKARIVRLEWERWDQAAARAQEYPDGGEPEEYILGRPHDPELAEQIGPVWEVVVPNRAERAGADLWRDRPATLHMYASQRGKDWLEAHAGRWLTFADG